VLPLGFVHANVADVAVTLLTFRVVGARHVTIVGVVQVTLAIHPALITEASLLNLKVKQPLVSEDVNGPGIVVPQNPPASAPGTFPAAFPLGICGEVIEFPLKTYKAS
jgi:hypothetical protein